MLWCDGRLHEGSHLPFDLADRGLLLGDGVFDTAMALNGRIAFEEAHVARLDDAARSLGFAIDRDRVVTGMRALAGQMRRAVVRTNVSRGAGPRGLLPPPVPMPTHWASAAPLSPGSAFAPLTLVPALIRRNETSPASRLKTFGYLDAIIATGEARRKGFDEALFLNTRDRVACAGTGNLFLVEEGRLLTPALSDGALAGVIRGIILFDIAPALGVEVHEAALDLDRFLVADSVFLTNSLRLAAPIIRIEERNIPKQDQGISDRIAAGLRDAVALSCGVRVEAVTSA